MSVSLQRSDTYAPTELSGRGLGLVIGAHGLALFALLQMQLVTLPEPLSVLTVSLLPLPNPQHKHLPPSHQRRVLRPLHRLHLPRWQYQPPSPVLMPTISIIPSRHTPQFRVAWVSKGGSCCAFALTPLARQRISALGLVRWHPSAKPLLIPWPQPMAMDNHWVLQSEA